MMPFIPGTGSSLSARAAGKQAQPSGGAAGGTRNGAATPPATAASSLFSVIAEDLAAVEEAIQRVAEVRMPLLKQTLRLILSAGGKRVRPALTLLAARLHENALHRRVELAVASELLHTASLAHDDVLDVSDARRGKPTINSQFNNTLAVLTGDYLFGKSGELVAGLDDPRIMGVYSWAVMELVEGEILRPSVNGDLDETERDYLAKIRGKTASLFAMSCKTGAMLDARDADLAQRMHDYGTNLGIAFQIADDVLDYTATEEQLGKPVGSDLRQGTVTLPALTYLRRHPGDTLVRGILAHDEAAQARVEEAIAAIRESGATDESLARARDFSRLAVQSLDGLGAGPVVEALRRLAQYVVERHE